MSSSHEGISVHHTDKYSPDDVGLHVPPTLTPPRSSLQAISEGWHTKDTEIGLESDMKPRAGPKPSSAMSREEGQWKNGIVTFDSKADPQNPKNWSYGRKAFVTMLLGLTTSCAHLFIQHLLLTFSAVCSTFASSVFSPAFRFVSEEYHVSTEVVILGLSLYVVGFIPGPISARFAMTLIRVLTHHLSRIPSLRTIIRSVWKTDIGAHTDVYLHLLLGSDGNSNELADDHDYEILRWRNG
jgi:hypothetical protein